jgi:hypothetical protein
MKSIKQQNIFFRVNLTYRVKSAHKLKLTDKQLLQWMLPILLVMLTYLSAWTISDPPQVRLFMPEICLRLTEI